MTLPVKKITNLLKEDDFNLLKTKIKKLKKLKLFLRYDSTYKRYFMHNPPFFSDLHKELTTFIDETFNVKAKPSYSFLSMYNISEGICPLHTDREQCKYTIDLCLETNEPWSIYVNDIEYPLDLNEALLFSGTDHPHYRNKIQKGNQATYIFFHYVDEDFKGSLE